MTIFNDESRRASSSRSGAGGDLCAATGILCCIVLAVTGCSRPLPTQAERPFLTEAWNAYTRIYIQPDGYALDPSRGKGETTSEGQGYALLRAVWMRDEGTFQRVFDWTERRLRRADGLYSWRWTPDDGGHVVDANTASDADQEIAFALILASEAFNRKEFGTRGRDLVRTLRLNEGLTLADGWFPAAGNWAVSDRIVNLSYFIPYAYPYFARVDPEGSWDRVIDTGYRLIASATGTTGVRLIPDFMTVTTSGEVAPLPKAASVSRDFSSDAMRVFWRVAFDCQLHRRVQACADPLVVGRVTSLLARDGRLFTRYGTDGTVLERAESASFYGAVLPYLLQHAPASGRAVEAERLSDSSLKTLMTSEVRYYDANWVWFGLAAADGFLTRRTPPLPREPVD